MGFLEYRTITRICALVFPRLCYNISTIQGECMKVLTFVLCVIATSLLFNACTTESDPAPKCTTKAISYQDFKADYKPSDGS